MRAFAIDSEVGRGATFLFVMPVHVGGVAEASAIRTKSSSAVETPWWKKMLGFK